MICRKAILRFPMPLVPLLEHKNLDFVLGLEAGDYYFTREEPLDVVDDAVWR